MKFSAPLAFSLSGLGRRGFFTFGHFLSRYCPNVKKPLQPDSKREMARGAENFNFFLKECFFIKRVKFYFTQKLWILFKNERRHKNRLSFLPLIHPLFPPKIENFRARRIFCDFTRQAAAEQFSGRGHRQSFLTASDGQSAAAAANFATPRSARSRVKS